MMKQAISNVLEKMNDLEMLASKYDDLSYEAYQNNNIKKSDYYERKTDDLSKYIEGFRDCMKKLGFGIWKDKDGHWHIPNDDIERMC